MRRALVLTVGLILAAAGLATFKAPGAKLYAGEATANPTVVVRFPLLEAQATNTPTATPTATETAVPTNTSPPPPTGVSYPVSTGHLSGGIYWKEGKTRYYMNIEWIKYMHWFFNNSVDTMERYKILGVNVIWPDGVRNQFHTSWATAPDYVAPQCYGPNGETLNWGLGLRCGANQDSAQSEDHIGGGGSDVSVDTPGTYKVQYFVCQSVDCGQGSEWHQLGSDLEFIADPPPQAWHVAPAFPRGDICRLIMTGPDRGRLACVPRPKS